MKNGEEISERQKKLKPLTVGEFKKIIRKNKIPDDTPMFADYPEGWSGLFQLYTQDGSLFFLASDNENDSGIGGNYNNTMDCRLWQADGLSESD